MNDDSDEEDPQTINAIGDESIDDAPEVIRTSSSDSDEPVMKQEAPAVTMTSPWSSDEPVIRQKADLMISIEVNRSNDPETL